MTRSRRPGGRLACATAASLVLASAVTSISSASATVLSACNAWAVGFYAGGGMVHNFDDGAENTLAVHCC